jgi:aerobic-type carbon monoxide dehydrogenase small subunit (CoxS/CutS family)
VASLSLTVNGERREVSVDPSTPLIYVLRNKLGLTGTKLGCALEQCGACSILSDGRCVPSCVKSVSEFVGHDIVTIEGLTGKRDGILSPVQQAFMHEGAAQCGYCTPGMIIATTALLQQHPHPSLQQIHEALRQQICRCGSYAAILRAVEHLTGAIPDDKQPQPHEKPLA